MNCPDQLTISAFVDGELEAAQAVELERHVAACVTCRQFVEEIRWLEGRGRAALGSILVAEASAPNIVRLPPPSRKWARLISLAAAAAAVLVLSIWTWFALNHISRNQAPKGQIANLQATIPNARGQSEESSETAFEQWAAPYRKLEIPLVPMDVVASYNPAPIPPIQPDDIERNNL